MMRYFEDNQLKLNLSKSSYLIINPSIGDRKCSIKLEKGLLEYKCSQYYLGIIISDDGLISHDVDTFIKGNEVVYERNLPIFVQKTSWRL